MRSCPCSSTLSVQDSSLSLCFPSLFSFTGSSYPLSMGDNEGSNTGNSDGSNAGNNNGSNNNDDGSPIGNQLDPQQLALMITSAVAQGMAIFAGQSCGTGGPRRGPSDQSG